MPPAAVMLYEQEKTGMKRFGIVGAGIIAAEHKKALMKRSDCIIAAVCDVIREKAEVIAEGTQARVYTDYHVMCEEVKPDAVIINLPHFLHCEATVYFLEKKTAVLVEKPMANTVSECDRMIAASEKNGAPLAVAHLQRFRPSIRALRKIVAEGRLGALCAVTDVYNCDYFQPTRPAWFLCKEQAGGGITMNYGAHGLDKLLSVTGGTIESVTAAGNNFINDRDVEACSQLLVRLSDGASAVMTYCGTKVPAAENMEFYFADGYAKLKNASELSVSRGTEEPAVVPLPDAACFEDQLDAFIRYIDGEESDIPTGIYGREIIRGLEQAFGSMDIRR